MRFAAYIILMFSITTSLYFLGYQPIALQYIGMGSTPTKIACPTGDPTCTDTTVIIGAMFAVLILAAGLLTLITGFSAIYVIPIFILLAILNFFILPLNFLVTVQEPLIKYPILGLLNILTVLAVTNFIRGNT